MPNLSATVGHNPNLDTQWEIRPASDSDHDSFYSVQPTLDGASTSQAIPVPASPVRSAGSSTLTQIQAPQAAQTALRGNFSERHPKLAMGLAGVAAKFAFFSSALALTPLFWVAAPVRFFVIAVGVLSPQLALRLSKTEGIKQAMGWVAQDLIRITGRGNTTRQRQDLAVLLGLDVGTLGGSFSAVSALNLASSASTMVRKQTAMALGFTEARFHGHASRLNARAVDRREDRVIAAALAKAPPVMKSIHQFFDVLGQATPKTKLDERVWARYEKKYSPPNASSNAFSALLKKNREGFPKFNVGDTTPFDNYVKQNNFKTFVNDRLHPVLLAMQGNEKIAKNAFELAERGLGSCSDRAASVWLTLELSTLSLKYSERILKMLAKSPELTPLLEETITKFVKVERQRFRLNEAMRFTDHYIQDAQRDPAQGGWQSRDTFKPYAALDHVEVILGVCDQIQKSNRQWFPSFPYKCYGSGFTNQDQTTLKNKVISELRDISLDRTHAKFLEHLKTTDAWKSIVSTVHPTVELRNLEALGLCEGVVEELGNLSDVFSHADAFPEYENAMGGLSALRQKFNAEPLRPEDAALPSAEFLSKHLNGCAPALARAEVELGQGDLHAILTQANKTWAEIQTKSSPLANLLNDQLESNSDVALPSQLTQPDVAYLHAVLKQIETLADAFPSLVDTAQNKIQGDIQNDFQEQGGKLTHTLKGVNVFALAQGFLAAFEQLKAAPLGNDHHSVVNDFTLKYINKISRNPVFYA